MKKVLLVLGIIIVILLAICLGGFLVFKDELDVLTEGLENGNIMNAVSKVIEVQGSNCVEINEDTYIMKTNTFKENIDAFIEEKYDVKKMQDIDTMILYESKDESKVISVTFSQYSLYTMFDVKEKEGKGTEFTINFKKKKRSGKKQIINAKKYKLNYEILKKSKKYDYNI